MLNELEKAIEEVRERKRVLLKLREMYDHTSYEQPPEMVPLSFDFCDVDGGYSTSSSRLTKTSRKQTSSQCDANYTFRPAISERSRKIAARLDRDNCFYSKSSRSVDEPVKVEGKPNVSALTTAIANRIKSTYGSLDEYYNQRKENAITYKNLTSKREADELKECTFHPDVKRMEPPTKLAEKVSDITGLESFVQRLEKARQKRLMVAEPNKPGSGQMYTGEPTKIQPFSFLNRASSNRTRIRE